MTRSLWAILGALVIVALGWFFWPTGNQTTMAPPAPQPAAQAPSPPPAAAAPPAASTAEQAPASAPAAQAPGASVGQAGDAGAAANDKATNELASLKPGFIPKDLITALNDSVINFPTGSAEVP